MKKLTPYTYVYKHYSTKRERNKLGNFNSDGLVSQVKGNVTKLNIDYEINLAEASELYKRIVESIKPKAGESIDDLKIDLTKYDQYTVDGLPIPSSGSHEGTKIAKFDSINNTLNIFINEVLIDK